MPDWDPALYLKYANQRARPAADLISQIRIEEPQRIIDLGCGTGNSTEQLHQRWPKAELTGLDSSTEMLSQAQKNHPHWQWVRGYIERWQPEASYDLIFSNAALHWVPSHEFLFPRLLTGVARGGVLAVQMPNNFHSPAHTAMLEASRDPRWASIFSGQQERFAIQPAPFYYDVLRKIASDLNIWETEYMQVMDGSKAILDWIRSTGMRFYLERLPNDDQRRQFEEVCLQKFEVVYPSNDQGKVIFPFKRMFIIAGR